MRVYDIALFIFLFNATAGMIASFGILPGRFNSITLGFNIVDQIATFKATVGVAIATGVSLQAVFSWFNAAFLFLFLVITPFITIFVGIITGTYNLLQAVGVDSGIALIIQGLVWFIYLIGFMQFLMGRSIREFQ